MDNIAALADLVASAVSSGDRLEVGTISGGKVYVGGTAYTPSWAADIDPVDGKEVYCVISRGRCVVVGER